MLPTLSIENTSVKLAALSVVLVELVSVVQKLKAPSVPILNAHGLVE